jgi:hypothetical protein
MRMMHPRLLPALVPLLFNGKEKQRRASELFFFEKNNSADAVIDALRRSSVWARYGARTEYGAVSGCCHSEKMSAPPGGVSSGWYPGRRRDGPSMPERFERLVSWPDKIKSLVPGESSAPGIELANSGIGLDFRLKVRIDDPDGRR